MEHELEQEFQLFLPMMRERFSETEWHRGLFGRLDWARVRASERYFPLRFFCDGLSAYVYCFDNAAVYYAWSAVETAILTRLGREALEKEFSLEGRYPGERRLLTIAGETILTLEGKRAAEELMMLRNLYLHYFNVMWDQQNLENRFEAFIQDNWAKMIWEINERIPPELRNEALEGIKTLREAHEQDTTILSRNIPHIPGKPPNKKAQQYLRRRSERFLQWAHRGEEPKAVVERFGYGVERRDALDALDKSARILVDLKFVSNGDDK